MSNQVIHIYGASGSGTTTLGKYLSEKLENYFMDTDDYFWESTNPPYIQKRDRQKRLQLMKEAIDRHENVVIAGSLVGWGDELISKFTLAIRIEAETNLRIERLKKRETEHFGARIESGGDMYVAHCEFLKWAAGYDSGSLEMRSKRQHDEWQQKLKCSQIMIDGSKCLEEHFELIKKYLECR